VADANNNQIATCVVGPIAAVSGTHTNTATASGIYNGTTYTSNPSSATYEAPPQTSINLYLPELSENQRGFSSQIQAQVDEFMRANTGVTITVNYYSDIQSLKNGNVIGIFALKSEDVRDFAQQELLLPVTALPPARTYLADALERSTINGQLFAYPWRREFCTLNYVNLAISAKLPSDVAALANNLSDFLTNEANQRSNFEAWQIYPALDGFYRTWGESKFPEVSCSDADTRAMSQAPNLFAPLVDKFGIKINFDLAKGLDSAQTGDAAGQLVGTIVPISDKNQVDYKGWEIEGVFSIDNNLLTLETTVLINKGTTQNPPLPAGTYMVACNLQVPNDCLAVSQTGEEFLINTDTIDSDTGLHDLHDQANISFARYEQGSTGLCFFKKNKKPGICFFGKKKKK